MTPDEYTPRRRVKELFDSAERAEAERARLIPDEAAALLLMSMAYQRLLQLGFQSAVYCPKDGSTFEAVEAGSTGIHICHYQGEWPDGGWWMHSGDDFLPSYPCLFRPIQDPRS